MGIWKNIDPLNSAGEYSHAQLTNFAKPEDLKAYQKAEQGVVDFMQTKVETIESLKDRKDIDYIAFCQQVYDWMHAKEPSIFANHYGLERYREVAKIYDEGQDDLYGIGAPGEAEQVGWQYCLWTYWRDCIDHYLQQMGKEGANGTLAKDFKAIACGGAA